MSCIAWKEERESERRRNLCGGGKERKMREAGIDGKQFSRKYGGRVPEAVVGDDAIDGKCVACSGS